MSAQQLIDQVKSLPADERKTFAILFEQLQTAPQPPPPNAKVDWAATFDRTFQLSKGKPLAENVILAARREERW